MVKYNKSIMCVFKDENGQQYPAVNHIFADELIRDREKGYLTLEMNGTHVMFNTHVKSVRITNNKLGGRRAKIAYIHLSL